MAGDSPGLAGEVRCKLDEGTPADDVIEQLVARGLSRPTARRFVDRALDERTSASWTPHEPLPSLGPSEESTSITDHLRNPDAVAESQAYRELTRGAILLAIGVAWVFATPGRARFRFFLAFGLFVFGRGIVRCAKLARPFPWRQVLTRAAIPVAALAAAVGWNIVQREREARAVAAAELAAADRSRAEQIREESDARRNEAGRARAARRDARVDEALAQLSSKRSMAQCDAASVLGRSGSREHVPPLINLLNTTTVSSVRICAVSALVELGETGTALAAYIDWVSGDNDDQRRSAIMGFGEIGPSVAGVALPYLTEALKSPRMDLRYLAVESLSKLGPQAVPLLEVAAGDADKDVRARAARALRERTPD